MPERIDLMRRIYNILFTVAFWLSSPYYFFKMWRRRGWLRGFSHRFGRFSSKIKQAVTNRHVLWIHAVSVGEVNIATQLIRSLETRLPNLKIVVSTTTSTGMADSSANCLLISRRFITRSTGATMFRARF